MKNVLKRLNSKDKLEKKKIRELEDRSIEIILSNEEK